MRRFGVVLGLIFILGITEGQAQERRYLQIAARQMSSQIYYEAFALPTDGDASALVVSFRIPNDRLVFMRNHEGEPGQDYQAGVDLTVEIYKDRELVDEYIWKQNHYVGTYEATTAKTADLEGAVTFEVAPGQYAFRLLFNDLNTEQSAASPLRPVEVPDFTQPTVGKAILADDLTVADGTHQVRLTNLRGQARFNGSARAVVPVHLPEGAAPADVQLRYTLREPDAELVYKSARDRRKKIESQARKAARNKERLVFESGEEGLKGGTVVREGTVPVAGWIPAGKISVEVGIIVVGGGDAGANYLAMIDLEGPALENGTYMLDLTLENQDGEALAERMTRVATHWRNMPFSLYDLDVAFDNMRYILNKKELKALKKGNRNEKRDRFRAFWKERDPSPETAYNELMAEYYERVDHAAFTYRTGGAPIPNGLETDQAKIYIVHGPPMDVKRELPLEGGVQETWIYADGKTIVFHADSSLDTFRVVKSD